METQDPRGVAGEPAIGRERFLELMRERYACKLYDQARPLDDSEVRFILECARLSPSSFGIEHWRLFAVRSPDAIARLADACLGQDAVRTASLAVVAATPTGLAFAPDSALVRERGSRFPGGLGVFVADYRGYYEFLDRNGLVDHWARAQCYIACANMMTGARAAGIDSCAIEGFEDERVLAVVGLEPGPWQTGIVTVFGHAADVAPREKIRMPLNEIASYL